jgi:hypothetical protein
VRRAIGADSGKREQARRNLVIGNIARGRREVFQFYRAAGDAGGERAEVGAAIPGADDVAVESFRGRGHRLGLPGDQRFRVEISPPR